jgi:hypothetical protein
MDTQELCKRLVRNGDAHVSFARLNSDSTWAFEITEVQIVGRTMNKIRHMLESVTAVEALFYLADMLDSAKTEAKYEGRL